jgi:UDP-N-acetylmuramoylalanine--D-glutamate ligase
VTSVEINALSRTSDWSSIRVCVVGLGIAGFAAADALIQLDAQVTILDANPSEKTKERATILEILGAEIIFGDDVIAAKLDNKIPATPL